MCYNPKLIERDRDVFFNMSPSRLDRLYEASGYTKRYLVQVPCGKCAACLKSRQNDLAARCVKQAQISGSMQFLTLTYDEQHLPFSMTLERVDKDSGEVDILEPLRLVTRQLTFRAGKQSTQLDTVDPKLLDFVRTSISLQKKNRPRYVYKTLFEDEDYLYQCVLTPSLNPRDVRLWLKSARVKYEREYGCKLSPFKYVVCGEMGSNTHRPHYHLCFFGLSNHDVRWLASYWNYGFTYLKTVRAVNQDGTSGFEIASRYVAKYMTKGDFECDSVKLGYAYKCRLMSSKHLGGSLPSVLVNYFRCYDLVGTYDISQPLPQDKLDILVSEVQKRTSFVVGDKSFRLPNSFIKQIWYVYSQPKGRFVSSVVRSQITASLQANLLGNRLQELHENNPGLSVRECFDILRKEALVRKSSFSAQNERGMSRYKKFYLSSNF